MKLLTRSTTLRPGRVAQAGRFIRRFAPMVKPYWRRVVLAGLCMLGFIASGLLAPWPIQWVLDGVLLGKTDRGILAWLPPALVSDRQRLLLFACAAVVVLAVGSGLFSYGQRLLAASVGHRVIADLRVAVFNKLQRLSMGFHGRQRTGDLLVRMTGDVAMLREILVPAVLDTSSRILILAGMLALMAVMDWQLTLLAVALLPMLALVTVRFGSRIRSVARQQRKKEGKIATVAGEALSSVAVVQAFSQEDRMAERFTRQNRRSLRAGLKTLKLSESLARIVEISLALGTCGVLWFGARRALAGSLSPGELIVFLTYLRGLYKPVQGLVRTAAKAGKAMACGDRVLEVLDSREVVAESASAVEAPPLRGEIVFDNVTFGYHPERPVLRNLSFRIGPGEKVGLVGPSGSGKSTLLALLLRLYEPQSGRILVDGRDIRDFTLESYRRNIGVVLQEPFLFGVTIEENILLGRPDAGHEQVVAAARAAGAAEFIERLPDGYATVLGERGTSLSRGQQQRIAIARTLIRDAAVLVFDEPTTGVDVRTEADVIRTLSRVGRRRTCLWIAHDLDPILGCSRVLVLQQGALVQDGVPEALLASAGAFGRLFSRTGS